MDTSKKNSNSNNNNKSKDNNKLDDSYSSIKSSEFKEASSKKYEYEEEHDIYFIIKNNKKNIILSFIVGFGLIFAILFLVGLNDVLNALKRTNLWILGLTFIIQAFVILIWALRWKIILDNMDQSPKFLNVVGILITSIFGNNITPGSIGGEPLRAYLLKEYNETPIEVGFASTMADRVFELMPFIFMAIVATIAIVSWDLEIFSKIIIVSLILVMLLLFFLVLYAGINRSVSENIAMKILNWIFPFFQKITKNSYDIDEIKEDIISYTNNFNSSFRMIVENKKLFFTGAFLALLAWGLDLFNSYLSFISIGVTPPIAPFITIFTIAILLSFLPVLPGSLGVTEIIMVALFVPVGITADYVIAASAIERVASYIIPTIIGLLVAFYYGKSISSKYESNN